MKLAFEPIVTSQNTFVRGQESRAVMILVWVDDFIVMGQDLKLVEDDDQSYELVANVIHVGTA